MKHEYYFSETVDTYTWEHFITQYHKDVLGVLGALANSYQRITGYGWKDTFGLNYNGEAFFINAEGNEYRGIWFDMDDTRIAVFKK